MPQIQFRFSAFRKKQRSLKTRYNSLYINELNSLAALKTQLSRGTKVI